GSRRHEKTFAGAAFPICITVLFKAAVRCRTPTCWTVHRLQRIRGAEIVRGVLKGQAPELAQERGGTDIGVMQAAGYDGVRDDTPGIRHGSLLYYLAGEPRRR